MIETHSALKHLSCVTFFLTQHFVTFLFYPIFQFSPYFEIIFFQFKSKSYFISSSMFTSRLIIWPGFPVRKMLISLNFSIQSAFISFARINDCIVLYISKRNYRLLNKIIKLFLISLIFRMSYVSIIEWFGDRDPHACGYCKGSDNLRSKT